MKRVEVRFGTEVVGVELAGGRVAGVRLGDGSIVSCPRFVSASGPWCRKLFEQVGLDCNWQLDATRIQMVHIDRPAGVQGDLPVVCDPAGGIYFRTQNRGQQIIVGSVLEGKVDRFDTDVDPGYLAFDREPIKLDSHNVLA